MTITGQKSNIIVNNLQFVPTADLSQLNMSLGTIFIHFICKADSAFSGFLKSYTQNIDLYIADNSVMTIAEDKIREICTYTDAHGTANKGRGSFPNKLVTKRGNGNIILDDLNNVNRAIVSIPPGSGGNNTIVFTDVDIVNSINNTNQRPPGDHIDTSTNFTFVMSDGTSEITTTLTMSM